MVFSISVNNTTPLYQFPGAKSLANVLDSSLFRPPSRSGHHGAFTRVPCVYSMFPLVIYVIHSINSV